MKILNYGSLNIDYTYKVPSIVKPGETIHADALAKHPGGKGLNQSIALARAGASALHAGKIGADGQFLKDLLKENHIGTDFVLLDTMPSGQAIIQVDPDGQNCIIVYGGANMQITKDDIDTYLQALSPGDLALCQNETSHVDYFIQQCHEKSIKVAFNPSPITASLLSGFPINCVNYLFINEIEGSLLTKKNEPEEIISALLEKYPEMQIILTLGDKGAYYADRHQCVFYPAFTVKAVDTTAAGDTFTGYFLKCMTEGFSYAECLKYASAASSIAVGKPGASSSIPYWGEVIEKCNWQNGLSHLNATAPQS